MVRSFFEHTLAKPLIHDASFRFVLPTQSLERYRRMAGVYGQSLAAWMRDACSDKANQFMHEQDKVRRVRRTRNRDGEQVCEIRSTHYVTTVPIESEDDNAAEGHE